MLAAELLKIFMRLGLPKEGLTDQGTNLMSEVMQTMWDQLGVRHVYTSVYHPQCNGLMERFNKTLKAMLRKFALENPGHWPQLIEPVLCSEGSTSGIDGILPLCATLWAEITWYTRFVM